MRSAIILFILLAGCARIDESAYPSLAPRAIESRSEAITTPPPQPPAAASAALVAEIAAAVARADAGATSFDRAFAEAQRLSNAADGAAVGSDRWVEAQIARSALEAERVDATSALVTLDSLIAERVAAGEVAGLGELETARERVRAIVEGQSARLAALPELAS